MASNLHQQRLELERRRGAREGEAFDRGLRDREVAEREERMSRMVWGVEQMDPVAAAQPWPALGTLQLQDELTRLRDYYNAVQKSRAWRLTQRLRRLVGRAW
jgi:hypothetical protein